LLSLREHSINLRRHFSLLHPVQMAGLQTEKTAATWK
jgi:hypothetical protein